jgi:uncharacterized protein (DUF433 family)
MAAPKDIYGGTSPIDAPAYTAGALAHHLRLPEPTVRYWAFGRESSKAIIIAADLDARLLSFRNLVELHVLSAVRREHRVALKEIRNAVNYLRRDFASEHPLSDEQMLTDGKFLFIKRLGKLINASRHGQLAAERLLEAHLQRIERDALNQPVRLFPFTREKHDGPRAVVIDPRVQFGRPCIVGSGVPTEVIAQRFKAGDSMQLLAEDYRRKVEEIEEAIRYETELKAA